MTAVDNDTLVAAEIARELRAEADNLSPGARTHPAGQMIEWAERLEAIANRTTTVLSGVAIIQIMREHLRITMERDHHGIVFQIDPVSVGAAAAAILALQDKGAT